MTDDLRFDVLQEIARRNASNCQCLLCGYTCASGDAMIEHTATNHTDDVSDPPEEELPS